VNATRAPRLCHLEAVHRDVEVAALEGREERLPVVLHELRAHAEPARERIRELHLEADETAAARILEHVRLPALDVAAPAQRTAGVQAGERVVVGHPRAGGEQRDERQRPADQGAAYRTPAKRSTIRRSLTPAVQFC